MTDLAYAEPEFEEDEAPADEQALPLELLASQGVDLAFLLEDQILDKIAKQCLEAYQRDKSERADWEEGFDKIMSLVRGERDAKTFPWPGASNAKYPLIMTAALQFGARAYPAIVNGSDVVKCASIGEDPQGEKRARGDRVSTHMNYQLLHDMPEWDGDTDRLCHALPIQGTMFRQVVWDSEYARPETTLLNGKCLVITQNAKSLETVPHFAKEFPLFVHQLREKMLARQYRNIDLGIEGEEEEGENAGEQDMLECHCRYDLDGDGYAEPWIAIIHKTSEKILSLKAGFWGKGVERDPQTGEIIRIRRHVEFIKYGFLPHPEGKFYDIGFGQLLLEHSELVNSILNQLIDAATDQNAGGGFLAQGVNLQGGVVEVSPGEWVHVNIAADDLRKGIVPRPTSQPSPVLFQLLGLLVESGKELSANNEVMSGDVPPNQAVGTTLAQIEMGMQVFSSIYKRMYRAMTGEFRLIAKLNGAYLDPQQYNGVIDGEQLANPRMDYEAQSRDIIPVADPSVTTSAQKLTRAQFLLQIGAGNPLLDQKEIMRRVLEAGAIDDIESLMPPPNPQEEAMQAETMKIQLRKAMAEIMAEEAGAMEDMQSARLKHIEGNIKAQEAAMELAAMRLSAMNLMGMAYGPAGMGGMAGMAGLAPGPAPMGGFGGPGGPAGSGLEGGVMGVPGAGPAQPGGQTAPDARAGLTPEGIVLV